MPSAVHSLLESCARHSDSAFSFAPFPLSRQTRQQLLPMMSHRTTPFSVKSREEHLRRRMIEFDSGRACASSLLRSLGCTDAVVGVAGNRAPIWPKGFVGSITHTDRWLAVAVARCADVRSLGIDVETLIAGSAVDEIALTCLNEQELSIAAQIGMSRASFVTVCFSAKESLYKCLHPLVQKYFDFHDAEVVHVNRGTGRLHIQLRRDLSEEFHTGVSMSGTFRRAGAEVFTSFELSSTQQGAT